MKYKSENKKLESDINDLMSRALKIDPDRHVEYCDLLIVLKAVIELQKKLNSS